MGPFDADAIRPSTSTDHGSQTPASCRVGLCGQCQYVPERMVCIFYLSFRSHVGITVRVVGSTDRRVLIDRLTIRLRISGAVSPLTGVPSSPN